VLSDPFSWQHEKEKENHRDAIFSEKNHFFSILISEFQKEEKIIALSVNSLSVAIRAFIRFLF